MSSFRRIHQLMFPPLRIKRMDIQNYEIFPYQTLYCQSHFASLRTQRLTVKRLCIYSVHAIIRRGTIPKCWTPAQPLFEMIRPLKPSIHSNHHHDSPLSSRCFHASARVTTDLEPEDQCPDYIHGTRIPRVTTDIESKHRHPLSIPRMSIPRSIRCCNKIAGVASWSPKAFAASK